MQARHQGRCLHLLPASSGEMELRSAFQTQQLPQKAWDTPQGPRRQGQAVPKAEWVFPSPEGGSRCRGWVPVSGPLPEGTQWDPCGFVWAAVWGGGRRGAASVDGPVVPIEVLPPSGVCTRAPAGGGRGRRSLRAPRRPAPGPLPPPSLQQPTGAHPAAGTVAPVARTPVCGWHHSGGSRPPCRPSPMSGHRPKVTGVSGGGSPGRRASPWQRAAP